MARGRPALGLPARAAAAGPAAAAVAGAARLQPLALLLLLGPRTYVQQRADPRVAPPRALLLDVREQAHNHGRLIVKCRSDGDGDDTTSVNKLTACAVTRREQVHNHGQIQCKVNVHDFC